MTKFQPSIMAFHTAYTIEKGDVIYYAYAEQLDDVFYPSVDIHHGSIGSTWRASKCSKPLIALRRAITHACELAGEPERAEDAIAELEAKVKAV